jgi:hypothetical protein
MSEKKAKRATADPAEIDQRIIEAYVDDPRSLGKLIPGLSDADVRRRAAEIGLTREVVRDARLFGAPLAMRTCVRCDRKFLSIGPQNRLCRRCGG